MSPLLLEQKASCNIDRQRETGEKLSLRGRFKVEHFDIEGKLIQTYEFDNDIVNVGKNNIFDVYFSDGTATAASGWVIGLISLAGYSALAAADTVASHGGWTEFTGYSEGTRPPWGPGEPAAQSITNATPVTFSINASGTVKGIFVPNQNTKGGTTGLLWATALFTGDVPVTNGDSLKVTYTVSA